MSNFRLTLRGLARSPLFTITAILSLAVGIGANTSIFSIVDQIMLRLLPIKNPHEIVFLYHPGPVQGRVSNDEGGGPVFSYPMFSEMQKMQTAFTGLAGARGEGVSLSFKNQKGMIERRNDTRDRRAVRIHLTAEAVKRREDIVCIAQKMDERLAGEFEQAPEPRSDLPDQLHVGQSDRHWLGSHQHRDRHKFPSGGKTTGTLPPGRQPV